MTTPYIVLAKYVPSKWKAWKVGKDLTDITKKLGLIPHDDPMHGPLKLIKAWYSQELHAEVRKRTSNAMSAESYHYDGDDTPGAKPECCLVLWASNTPTEIKYKDKIYIPKPYELVIFKNMSVVHRRPTACPKIRWVFRQRVAVPDHMQLL